jgi:phosphoglycerate dehydrogenase-like enzyme
MVKVGVPEWVDSELLVTFPREAAIERIDPEPDHTMEVEFWIAPAYASEAARIFPYLRGVRVVQSLLAGVDWLQPILSGGIVLCDGRGMHNIPTAEWVIAAILNALKHFPLYGNLQRHHDWRGRREADAEYRALHPGACTSFLPVLQEELYGKRVMIIGYGSIGRSIEERLLPFGVEIVRVARNARPGVEPVARLLDLIPTADIVVLIVPQTPETAGMIGEAELARMKPGTLLVNAARGTVVDSQALLRALQRGSIRAAIDVTDPEPLPPDHPLWSAPNLFITPHVAASSPMFIPRAITFAAEQVARYIKGEPLENVVTGSY